MNRAALALAAVLALTACGEQAPGESAVAQGEAIWCAPAGAKELAQNCTLERSVEDGRAAFVVRHPDGKFRRLIASADGQQLLAADGAEQSQSALKQDRWEVILGDDRYVVPVKVDDPRP